MTLLRDIRSVGARTFQFWRGATSFDAFELKEALLGIVLISLLRAFTDLLFWHRSPNLILFLMTFILWVFYITSLCFSTAFLCSRLFPRINFGHALTMAVCLYWVVPLVPLFSLLPWEESWGLGTLATVPLFRSMPPLRIDRNYLPLGMVLLSPLIVLQATRFISRAAQIARMRVFLTMLLVMALIYLYYYQLAWAVYLSAAFDRGFDGIERPLAGYITYGFFSQAVTFLLSPVIARSYRGLPQWAYFAISGTILAILLLIPRVGVLAVFLSPVQP